MNCCGCVPQAGLTPGSAQYGLSPCLTKYDFKLLDNYAQIEVPVDGLYEVSVANFGTDVNLAVAGALGTNYAVVPLSAGSPIYIDYNNGTKLYQGTTVVDSGKDVGPKDYRQGVKVRLLGTATQERVPFIVKLSTALTEDPVWRDTVYGNGRTMLDMSGNRALVPSRFGDWRHYPTDSRMILTSDITVATAGTHKLYALSKTTLGIVVNDKIVQPLKDNKGGVYEGFGALSVDIELKAGRNTIVLQNSNTTGKATELYTSFVIAKADGTVLITPEVMTVAYERKEDCSANDTRAPRMECWFLDLNAPTGGGEQDVRLTTPGWYQIVVAASGQSVNAALPTNTGQGLGVFSAKTGDVVKIMFGDVVYATMPDGSIVESQPGDGVTKGAARLIFISKEAEVRETHSRAMDARPSWNNIQPDPRMKFTRVVSGFDDMASVPGNLAMYLIGTVQLSAGDYISTTWGDDISVVFLDGRMINKSEGSPEGSVRRADLTVEWQGWDDAIRPFTVTESGEHQIIIYNVNIPAGTPGWSCFTIQDLEGNVLHEIDTSYFALDTIYNCEEDSDE